jgi:hypothetical protein
MVLSRYSGFLPLDVALAYEHLNLIQITETFNCKFLVIILFWLPGGIN